LTLLTSPAAAELAALIPEVDEVIAFEAPWVKSSVASRLDALVERLRDGKFDAAAIFTTYTQSPLPAALICYLAEIPLRLAHCHENPYHLLTDWVSDPEPDAGIRHEVQRHLDLVANVGATTSNTQLSLHIPPEAFARVDAVLTAHNLDRTSTWVALHPGATAPSRRYAPERFAAAADLIVERTGLPIVLVGGPTDVDLTAEVSRRLRAHAVVLSGLQVADLAALIGRARLLVANNSGPAHIAAATGTPVVDLYALTNPQHTPWRVAHRVLSHDVPCRDCLRSVCPHGHNACLQLVSPIEVADAACELLELVPA
jgi:lipopolysaccharide heptosyltransferase II